MTVFIATTSICGDNERVLSCRTPMPQERWPYITTSVSGIAAEDWSFFKARARREKMTYRRALDEAIEDLVAAISRGETIKWLPSKTAPSQPVKLHEDSVTAVRALVAKTEFKQNVIIGTAMHRWATKQ